MTDAVGSRQADLEAELRDVKRVLRDDMDAANEATAVFGRLISALGDRLDAMQERLDEIADRLDSLVAGAPPLRRKPAAEPGPEAASPDAADPAG